MKALRLGDKRTSQAKAPSAAKKPSRRRRIDDCGQPDWRLLLYIAGPSPKSAAAFRNLEQICEDHLVGNYRIDVIDLVKDPKIARDAQIVAVPMVVRTWPLPVRKIIGDLSNTERVLATLDLRSFDTAPAFTARKGQNIF